MTTRRALLQRATAAGGVSLMAALLPRVGRTALASPLAKVDSFMLQGCLFTHGDPALNNPDWVEEWAGGVIIQHHELFFDRPLTIPAMSNVAVLNNVFRGHGIVVNTPDAWIVGNYIELDATRDEVGLRMPIGGNWDHIHGNVVRTLA